MSQSEIVKKKQLDLRQKMKKTEMHCFDSLIEKVRIDTSDSLDFHWTTATTMSSIGSSRKYIKSKVRRIKLPGYSRGNSTSIFTTTRKRIYERRG